MDDPFKSVPLEKPLFGKRPYDPEKNREWVRGIMTSAAMLIFAAVIGIYLVASFKVSNDSQWTRVKDATQVILPAVTSVLGTALGFYFGSQKK